ncbi:MAG: hypothetical protein QM742_10000 [Aquabacterium sp.]
MTLFYRPKTGGSAWTQMVLPRVLVDESKEASFYLDRSSIASNEYEYCYQVVDPYGSVLNCEAGTMTVSSGSVTLTGRSRQHVSGAGQAWMFANGGIQFTGQGKNAVSARLRLRLKNQPDGVFLPSISLTSMQAGGKAIPGSFMLDTSSLGSTPYEYVLECFAD